MRANFVEILSRIGLNLTNVEHFIGAACGLADDNPAIRREIHEAARQVQSSAQLIAHLRSLFAHQQTTVDWRQRLLMTGSGGGGCKSRSRVGAHEKLSGGGGDNNLGYFSYTNKQTLIKAARCLVANVAKILYLTDEIVLKSGDDVGHEGESKQAAGLSSRGVKTLGSATRPQRQRQGRSNANESGGGEDDDDDKQAGPILSDRLDNIANYSQLLRTFGEFSADLIDLGNCIMLARHVGAASRETTEACPCPGVLSPARDIMRTDELKEACSGAYAEQEDEENREQTSECANFVPGYQAATYKQHAQQYHTRAESSSYSVLAHRRLSRANQLDMPHRNLDDEAQQFGARNSLADGQLQPEASLAGQRSAANSHLANHAVASGMQVEADGVNRKQVAAGAGLIGAAASSERAPTCKMLARVHDVQVLFQVNRLIIERSILLLLSASKCCLRRGQEPERGFEARKLIGLQIRVSIGIIMALVKSSVFCAGPATWDDKGDHPSERCRSRRVVLGDSNREQNRDQLRAQADINLSVSSSSNQNANSNQMIEATNQWEILNHFLVTSSNTSNASDSIRSVQSLVELFVGVRNQDQLANSLELAVELAQSSAADARHKPLKQSFPPGDQLELDAGKQPTGANNPSKLKQVAVFPPVPMMDKRQLVAALNFVFLGELKLNLVERLQEFTDCAYTRHEHRESILSLLVCIKSVLHKFVKLIYRLRRRIASPSEPSQLSLLRQLAHQLLDCCKQLSYELQTVAIELADELDKLNDDLELIKQLKHNCLVGDLQKARSNGLQFCELAEQLVETCRMLNQIAPTNKLKISTKSLACWFQLNHQPLIRFATCLSEAPHSKTAKDCVWTYMQIWSSFYDDFCQLARQLAYLAHSSCDRTRASRVISLRQQVNNGGILPWRPTDVALGGPHQADGRVALPDSPVQSSLGSLQSLGILPTTSNQQFGRGELANEPQNDSPRSLDHYHGFGTNYRRWHETTTVSSSGGGGGGDGLHDLSVYVTGGVGEAWLPESPDLVVPSGAYLGASNQWDEALGCESSPQPRTPSNCSSAFSSVFTSDCRNEYKTMSASSGAQSHLDDQLGPSNMQPNRGRLGSGLGTLTPFSGLPITPLEPLSIRVDPTGPPIEPPSVPARRSITTSADGEPQNRPPRRPAQLTLMNDHHHHREQGDRRSGHPRRQQMSSSATQRRHQQVISGNQSEETDGNSLLSSTLEGTQTTNDKWSDSEADAIVRGARETAQMALSMYQFTRGEGDLNTTQDLFTQAELFAEEANELYKEVRCFSYKVPAGDLKKGLLFQLATIPALVQQLQFTVKNPTVGKAATFAKVDSVIRETKSLMEAVNRVVEATLACRQHYNMASASLRKRTRTLSPTYRNDKFEFDAFGSPDGGRSLGGAFGGPSGGAGGGGRHAGAATSGMGSEPDI